MRPFSSVISIGEARRLLSEHVRPVTRTESCRLEDAHGRVAADDVVASIFVPPFDRALMDGYAVVADDTTAASPSSPVTLRIADRIFTGQHSNVALTPGACAQIATGAPIPIGADAVVMVEETTADEGRDDRVRILAAAVSRQNIGARGADIQPGQVVVSRGDVLTASRIGALAAIGVPSVSAYARPRVVVLSTGNEVVAPGAALGHAEIYDVNRFTLGAVIAANGGVPDLREPVGDTIGELKAALEASIDADIIIFSGGSSVGERDLIVDLIESRGQMIFHGIAVKPGKPTAFAMVDGTPFFGMPGNPTSCLSNAFILFTPYLRATARLPVFLPRTVRAPMGRRISSPTGRHQFYTVRLQDGKAMPAFKGSGEITSLSQADGYIEIPAETNAIDEGTLVDVKLF
jgi:molybdenum cofactor synthesis domain-containing protein